MVRWWATRARAGTGRGAGSRHCGSWPASKFVTKHCHKNSCGLPHPISGRGREQPE